VSRGAWVAAIVAGVLFLVAVGTVLAVTSGDDESDVATPTGPVAAALDDAAAAREPFPGMTATTIRVGGEPFEVVLADEGDERYQGLRERDTLGPYDGMLFVFDSPSRSSFTMSTVPVPLDIGFYDERGRIIDRLLMKPCADSQSTCPLYNASGPFTYALETLKGDLPEGNLSK
jgi:uncharacterized membrane protein (UPF0127 family)